VPIYSDHVIPSLKRLVDAVHQYDTKFGIQLWDAGGTEGGKRTLISPSGLSSNARAKAEPRWDRSSTGALELDEIGQVVGYFAAAATRCEKAGL